MSHPWFGTGAQNVRNQTGEQRQNTEITFRSCARKYDDCVPAMMSVVSGGVQQMTIDELKVELAAILSADEASNWKRVEALSEQTYIRLTIEPETPQDYPHEAVISYLAGFIRRQSDAPFAEQQRGWLRSYLQDLH